MQSSALQLDSHGQLRHLLTTEQLDPDLILSLFKLADQSLTGSDQKIQPNTALANQTVVNLFFESSTRTRTTFEIAAKNTGAQVISLAVSHSATNKGESLIDTVKNLIAMGAQYFVIRHSSAGTAEFLAKQMSEQIHIINAGDGAHAHPSQALLDVYTLQKHKPDFKQLKVAIVGDILHSRVARSNIHLLKALQVPDIRLIAPQTLCPPAFESPGVRVFHSMEEGLDNVDVIMMLRLQQERMNSAFLPNYQEFYRCYGLNQDKVQFASPDVLIMHPGPMNRGVEIASSVADGDHSVILQQVHYGIAIRMAIFQMLAQAQRAKESHA